MRYFVASAVIVWLALGAFAQPPAAPAPWEQYLRPLWSRPAQSAFVRDWLVCGEFPLATAGSTATVAANATGLETDYLAVIGGEATAKPLAGQKVARPDGSEATWTAIYSQADAIDLAKAFAGRPAENVVGYAYTVLRSQRAREAYLGVGSDDGVAIWLNGVQIHRNRVFRGVVQDNDLVPVSLRDGDNTVLVKVEQGTKGWGFCLRVVEAGEALAMEKLREQPTLQHPPMLIDGKLVVNADNGLTVLREIHAPVRVLVLAPGGKTVARASVPYGKTVSFETAHWARGPYEVICRTTDAQGLPTVLHTLVFVGDALAAAKRLVESAPQGDGDAELAMIHALLRDLVVDRLGPDLTQTAMLPRVYSALYEYAELEQEAARKGTRAHGYGMVRFAYRDAIDDSPQFARVYLPADYSPKRRNPLLVSLHGMGFPLPPYYNFWGSDRRGDWRGERFDVIVLYPHGRGNTTYRGLGEADVLRTIAMTKARFSIDDDRVYLTGESMGGAGTWNVGSAHPELFAAIAPIYGGWDQRVWEPDGWQRADAWQRWCIEREGTYSGLESLLHMPILAQHGDNDQIVNVENTRFPMRMLQRWNYDLRYVEVPGKGHEALGTDDLLMRWLLQHRRVTAPPRVRLRATSLDNAAAYWARVDAREDANAPAQVDVEVIAPNALRLDTENVRGLTLSPGPSLINVRKPVLVAWNGATVTASPSRDGRITLGTQPAVGEKHAGQEGPVADLFNTPFAVVVGTQSPDPLMRAMCEHLGRRYAAQWEFEMRAKLRVFRDTELQQADWARYSLVLIGGPEKNLVARALAANLPFHTTPDGITLGGKAYAGPGLFACSVSTHPLARNRYLLLTDAPHPRACTCRPSFPPGHWKTLS